MAAAAAAKIRAPPSLLRLWLWLWTWASLSVLPPVAHAQFIQGYQLQNGAYTWRPNPSVTPQEVYDLAPSVLIVEYNCAYMTAICQNVINFKNSAVGQARPWRNIFGYDANLARRKKRGRAVCPGQTWKRRHSCPEVLNVPLNNQAQPPIQLYRFGVAGVPDRHVTWTRLGLKPHDPNLRGDIQHFIEDDVDPAGNVIESKMEYTCDEFPLRSLIEGGVGLGRTKPWRNNPPAEGLGQPVETRCAPSRWCSIGGGGGTATEQNWQAKSVEIMHSRMQIMGAGIHPNYLANHYHRPTLFRLETNNHGFNGAPAAIYWAEGPPPSTLHDDDEFDMIARRRIEELSNNKTAFLEWVDKVPLEQLLAGEGGHKITRRHVFVNDTENDMDNLEEGFSIPDMGFQLDLDLSGEKSDTESLSQESEPLHGEAPMDKESSAGRPRKLLPRSHLLARLDTSDVQGEADNSTAPLLRNATQADLEKALALVDAAIDKSAKLNEARYASPARNVYKLRPTSGSKDGARVANPPPEEAPPPPLIEMTPELAAAAALVAEAEALQGELGPGNGTVTKATRNRMQKRAGTFWMEHIARRGTVPLGDDPSYKVFRNVMDYGAKGDGVTDDTAAIQRAMDDGKRCGKGCNGSTVKNAIVYLPPGRYLVSRSIPVIFGTQLIGDAVDRPTIVASARFIGLGVLQTDVYTGGGIGADGLDQQWYINTANFYRQIRNLRIDVTQTRSAQKVACLHYQVAQATSLQYVELIAKPGTQQRGIFAENGSGGMISDIVFRGGEFGLYGGNQQFTATRLTFDGCATGVHIIWDWGWIWKSIIMTNTDVGFKLMREVKPPAAARDITKSRRQTGKNSVGNIGSASFIDSSFSNVGTVVLVAPIDSSPGKGSTGVVMENVEFSGVGRGVADSAGKVLLAGGSKHVDSWVTGPVYDSAGKREFVMGKDMPKYKREPSLLGASSSGGGDAPYYERPKPQYEGRSASDFIHLKDFARGDGVTDDTAGVQEALRRSTSKILFVDAGTYLIKSTVTVPAGAKIVGEAWSQFAATGSYFGDANNPKVMLKVGNKGDTGDVEMQDLLFTTIGPAAGAVLVEWNIKASSPGSAALWECHVRIGGALGTKLNPAECPPLRGGTNPPACQAASLMMHITSQASGYFENMWLWVADHLIDDLDWQDPNNEMPQLSIYVARGLLVESQTATWLYGTSSEHAVYYQYNLHNARNIFAGMIQTEPPYFQPMPKAPAPFEKAVDRFAGDPDYTCAGNDFDGCDTGWALVMHGCQNVFIAGAGLYSWFDTYTQDCISKHACQKAIVLLENNRANNRIQHLITIGGKYSVVADGTGVLALDNLNVDSHPRWSQITWFDMQGSGGGNGGDGSDYENDIWVHPSIWDDPSPTVWCEPPCTIRLPPWTGATSTIDYPIVTITDGTWTTRATRRPITVTEWVFVPITITGTGRPTGTGQTSTRAITAPTTTPTSTPSSDDDDDGRETITVTWPEFDSTTTWPPITYIDESGNTRRIRPTDPPLPPHPPPPPPPGPNPPPPPPWGDWPEPPIIIMPGLPKPTTFPCAFPAWVCPPPPGTHPDSPWGEDPDDPDEEEEDEEESICFANAQGSPKDLPSGPVSPKPPTGTLLPPGTARPTVTNSPKPDPKPTPEPLPEPEPEPEPEPVWKHPDPRQNEAPYCYGNGEYTVRRLAVEAARNFCRDVVTDNIPGGRIQGRGRVSEQMKIGSGQAILQLEVLHDDCEYIHDEDECYKYLRVPIDSCDCGGVGWKRGGEVRNNCIRARFDPQFLDEDDCGRIFCSND